MDLTKLLEPFPIDDIEWRIQSSGLKSNGELWGKCLAYVTNRAIMDRLDQVCGQGNWHNEFKPGPAGGVMCGITIWIASEIGTRAVTKWDGAENTAIEEIKGGFSGSMKRAAVQWGIGRYLYKLEEGWAIWSERGRYNAKVDNRWYKWDPPELPSWALPKAEQKELVY